jgi:hypothetical protein
MCQKLRVLWIAALVLGAFGAGPAGAYDASLCGWWPFDDGSGTVAVDASGKAVNGTLFGNPAWDREGKHGGSLTFDGVDDYVFIDGKFKYGNYTIAVWFRDDSPGQRDIISCYAATVLHGILLEVGSDNRLRFLHRFPLGTGGGSNLYTPFSADGNWHHVAATKSATEIALYLDGKEVGRMADTSVFGATNAFGICLGALDNDRGLARMFLGAMDDLQIYYRALSAAEIPGTMAGLVDKAQAMNVGPVPGATDVPRDTTLNWAAGQYAATHDVYLGTTFADVNTATRTAAKGVLVSQGQTGPAFTPAGAFAYGQTYYWRIDEVNKAPDGTIFKGNVWSFTVEPYSYPITKVTATASSTQTGMGGPEKTIDGSGLDAGDLHGTDSATSWTSTGVQPNWIQYQFDKVYKLDKLLVWNSNQVVEVLMGFGAKNVTIEYSVDGTMWTTLPNVPEFARAPGTPGYAANTTVNFGGVQAKFVKLTINANWGGLAPQTGLSEVRFSYIPVQAQAPQPAAGATGVDPRSVLSWRAGREATRHQVYVSADANQVGSAAALVGTVSKASFDAGGVLQLGRTYYWKVNEVNDAATPSVWEGNVWSFSTAPVLAVDDMESYNDEEGKDTRVYEVWVDGYGTKTNGSQVGYDSAPFADRTVFHGGAQSMPLRYNNTTTAFSEATRTFDPPQDWTLFGVKGLTLWFYGDPANTAATMYVKVNGKKAAYDGDPAALLNKGWHFWYVDLSTLTGVNLKKVTELMIGFEGGKGIVLFDDIALTPAARQLVTPVKPAATALVTHYLFDGNVTDTTGAHPGTVFGAPTYTPGKAGQAIKLDGARDYVDSPGKYSLPTYTVALWFRVDGGAGQRDLVSIYDEALPANHGILLEVQDPATLRYLHRAPVGVASANESIYSTSTHGDGTWYHVAAVKSATTMSLYLNGELAASAANSAVFDKALAHLSLGVLRVDSLSRYLPGAMDDFYLYGRDLSPAEIASLAGRTQPFDAP